MKDSAADLTTPQQALAAYIKGLLDDGCPDAHDIVPAATSARAPTSSTAPGTPTPGAGSFHAVLFDVAGLRLALPAERIRRVMALPEGSGPAAGERILLLRRPEGDLRICHTAAWVFPAGCTTPVAPPRRLLIIRETTWALACSAIVGMLTLLPSEIRWRTVAGRRPWLAGTAQAHACAVLDIDALLRLAEAQQHLIGTKPARDCVAGQPALAATGNRRDAYE